MGAKIIWPDKADCAFAIRDDDVSYFTDPNKLETIYKDAWKMGFKTSFAVIPMHKATSNLNVPPHLRGTLELYPVWKNEKLTSYLKSMMLHGKVDILQHGFCHTENSHLPVLKFDLKEGHLISEGKQDIDLREFSEFCGLSINECYEKVRKGKQILENTFNIGVKVFVPPQEYLSRNLWITLKKESFYVLGFNLYAIPFKDLNLLKLLSIAFRRLLKKKIFPENLFDISKVPSLVSTYKHYWNKYFNEKSARYWFNKVKEEFQDCIKRKGIFILHTHYWEYFYDWLDEVSQDRLLEYLYYILEYVGQYNVWKCRITELFEILKSPKFT
ncbi:MAG: DUF2334 domain-containing protein [Candidatus Bathycorpusculaceae bacterium]